MGSIAPPGRDVIGGVDTHQDLHMAAVIGTDACVLGVQAFSTTRAGYRAMLAWMRSHGDLLRVGVESTGSYGAGLTRHLALAGVPVLEVTGPNPSQRRAKGKDDTLDAIEAARAALTGQRVVVARGRTGAIEALRVLRTTRQTAVKVRRASLQLLHATVVAAPDEVREQLRSLTRMQLIRTCASLRPDQIAFRDPAVATRIALRSIARRILEINDEVAALDRLIQPLVRELGPGLLELEGVGYDSAGCFLVTAGDNPERLHSEAGFAMLCGAAPIPASSGKTERHRLNRGGDRRANSALHMVVISRMRKEPRTKAYVARRLAEGLTKREIMRCLKRYVAREVYGVLFAT
jgi:transposase